MLRSIQTISRTMPNTIESTLSEAVAQISLVGKDRTQVNDGQVLVQKGSGKTKVRKGQADEEYQVQKEQFESSGPMVNTLTWLEEIDITRIDPKVKSDRQRLENLTERLYFKKDYTRCLQITEKALDLFKDLSRTKIKNEIEELEYLQKQCSKKLSEEQS